MWPGFFVAECVRRKQVNSSVIVAVGHDTRSATLEVQFRTGRTYHYFGVPRSMYEEMLKAPSIGAYFNEEIRTRFQSDEITE